MANFQITSSPVTVENNEYNFSNLYLFHTPLGPNRNHFGVTRGYDSINQGEIVVNNWPIYDGVGPNASIVARAQGLHIHAGNWNNVFSIVFENQRFSGSTLEVMGISVEHGEYAIVGGTGQFSMARGVIYKKFHEQRSDGNIIQLTIRGFFPVLKWSLSVNRVFKIGPCGGNGGVDLDITDTPSRLESITLRHAGVIDAIQFSYINQSGQKRSTGRWGGEGGKLKTIKLGSSEFIKEVSGTIGAWAEYNNIISTITFVTNITTHGPFGDPRYGTAPFSIPVPNNSSIVGFFGRGKVYLDAIGVYVLEETAAAC